MKGEAARAHREGELISHRTKEALARRKKAGILLGNRTNIRKAQQKGAKAAARKAELRAPEQADAIKEAIAAGADSNSKIAQALNAKGFPTVTGVPWTKENVRQVRKRLQQRASTAPAAMEAVFSTEARLTSSGIARIEAVMKAQGIRLGAVMKDMGYPTLDASVGYAMRCDSRIKDRAKRDALEQWLVKNERGEHITSHMSTV